MAVLILCFEINARANKDFFSTSGCASVSRTRNETTEAWRKIFEDIKREKRERWWRIHSGCVGNRCSVGRVTPSSSEGGKGWWRQIDDHARVLNARDVTTHTVLRIRG